VRALDPTAPPTDSSAAANDVNDDNDVARAVLPDPAEDQEQQDGESGSGSVEDFLLPAGSFLIGNHADELTPWVPLLATRFRASGYLSIPCCAWSLDARFDRTRDVPLCAVDPATLNLGGEACGGSGGSGSGSSYAQFRVWLAALSVHCGWAVEVEMLRIPSTRNWAIVGKHHTFFPLPSPSHPFGRWPSVVMGGRLAAGFRLSEA
jgi:hypothetical protein